MHLDHESCLEVTVLKGKGAEVQSFANHVIAERGVRHGHVVYVPARNGTSHSNDHGHAHGHGHPPGRARRRAQ